MKEYEIVSEWKDEWEPHYKGYILDTVRLFDEEWNTHLYVVPRIAKDMNWNIRLSDDEEWEAVKKMREENEQIKEVKDKYRKQLAEEYKQYAWLTKRFFWKNFDNFEKLTDTHTKAVKFLAKRCDDYVSWETEKGVYLCWGVWVWKTHLVAAMVNALCYKWVRCIYKSVPTLLNDIKDTFDMAGDGQKRIIDKCSRVEVLVLDDIGTEKPSDRVAEVLYMIINNRYEDMKTTIFTSNLKVPELWDRLTPRISDRIYDMCQILDLSRITKSYRWR